MTENSEIDFFQFVDNDYKMDRETEKLVASAKLKEGMVVLIAGANRRVSLEQVMKDRHSKWLLEKALKYNRWFTISNISFYEDQVTFLATYEDGTLLDRVEPTYTSWFAKKPVVDEIDNTKRLAIAELIASVMGKNVRIRGEYVSANDVTDEIYKILGL